MATSGGSGVGIDALNTAWELLVRRPLLVVGGYTLAAAPMLVAMLYWVRAVAFEDRRAIALASVLVVCGAFVRAVVLSRFQTAVMRAIGFEPTRGLRGSSLLVGVFRFNAESALLLLWPLIVPGVLGLMCSGVATPMATTESRPVSRSLTGVFRYAWERLGWCARYAASLVMLFVLFWIGLLVTVAALVSTVLPALLNVDTTDLTLIVRGPAWWLGTGLVAVVFADMLHNVACCAAVKEQRARSSGADLHARLDRLVAERGGAL